MICDNCMKPIKPPAQAHETPTMRTMCQSCFDQLYAKCQFCKQIRSNKQIFLIVHTASRPAPNRRINYKRRSIRLKCIDQLTVPCGQCGKPTLKDKFTKIKLTGELTCLECYQKDLVNIDGDRAADTKKFSAKYGWGTIDEL